MDSVIVTILALAFAGWLFAGLLMGLAYGLSRSRLTSARSVGRWD